jgi:glutamate racemase
MGGLAGVDIVYFGDTARSPIGTKGPDIVLRSASEGLRILEDRGATLIVISCHTTAALAAGQLAEVSHLPVFDILTPTAREAARISRFGRIGVMTTEALAVSDAYALQIRKHRPSAAVWTSACPLLEPLVEEGRLDKPESVMIVKKYLAPLKQRRIDTLVPGIGHCNPLYPLIRRKAGRRVRLLDPVPVMVQRVAKSLKSPEPEGATGPEGPFECLLTDAPPWIESAARRLFSGPIEIAVVRF